MRVDLDEVEREAKEQYCSPEDALAMITELRLLRELPTSISTMDGPRCVKCDAHISCPHLPDCPVKALEEMG